MRHISLLLLWPTANFKVAQSTIKKYTEWRRDSRRALSAHFGLVVRLRSQTHGRLPLRRKDIAGYRGWPNQPGLSSFNISQIAKQYLKLLPRLATKNPSLPRCGGIHDGCSFFNSSFVLNVGIALTSVLNF